MECCTVHVFWHANMMGEIERDGENTRSLSRAFVVNFSDKRI